MEGDRIAIHEGASVGRNAAHAQVSGIDAAQVVIVREINCEFGRWRREHARRCGIISHYAHAQKFCHESPTAQHPGIQRIGIADL